MKLGRGNVGTNKHVLRVGYLEERLSGGHELALLHIFLQYGARDGSLHIGVGYLVDNLALLGVEPFYLRPDALALLCQTSIVATNLVACGIALTFQHL